MIQSRFWESLDPGRDQIRREHKTLKNICGEILLLKLECLFDMIKVRKRREAGWAFYTQRKTFVALLPAGCCTILRLRHQGPSCDPVMFSTS